MAAVPAIKRQHGEPGQGPEGGMEQEHPRHTRPATRTGVIAVLLGPPGAGKGVQVELDMLDEGTALIAVRLSGNIVKFIKFLYFC